MTIHAATRVGADTAYAALARQLASRLAGLARPGPEGPTWVGDEVESAQRVWIWSVDDDDDFERR